MFCPDRRSAFPFPWPFFYLTFWKLCSSEKALTSVATIEQYTHQACITSAPNTIPRLYLCHCYSLSTWPLVSCRLAAQQAGDPQSCRHPAAVILQASQAAPPSHLFSFPALHQTFGSSAQAFPAGNRTSELSQLKDTCGRDGRMKNRGEHAAFQPPAGLIFPSS